MTNVIVIDSQICSWTESMLWNFHAASSDATGTTSPIFEQAVQVMALGLFSALRMAFRIFSKASLSTVVAATASNLFLYFSDLNKLSMEQAFLHAFLDRKGNRL